MKKKTLILLLVTIAGIAAAAVAIKTTLYPAQCHMDSGGADCCK